MVGQVASVEILFNSFVYKFSISSRFSRGLLKSFKNSYLLVSSAATLEVFDRGVGVWHEGLNI